MKKTLWIIAVSGLFIWGTAFAALAANGVENEVEHGVQIENGQELEHGPEMENEQEHQQEMEDLRHRAELEFEHGDELEVEHEIEHVLAMLLLAFDGQVEIGNPNSDDTIVISISKNLDDHLFEFEVHHRTGASSSN